MDLNASGTRNETTIKDATILLKTAVGQTSSLERKNHIIVTLENVEGNLCTYLEQEWIRTTQDAPDLPQANADQASKEIL